MSANTYQELSLRTWDKTKPGALRRLYLAAALNEEAGEVAGIIKKNVYHGKPLDVDALRDELGDVMWHVAIIASEFGIDLEAVMAANIAKLEERHPTGDTSAFYTR